MAQGKLSRGSGSQSEHLQAIPLVWAEDIVKDTQYNYTDIGSDSIALLHDEVITIHYDGQTRIIPIPKGTVLALQNDRLYSFGQDSQVLIL